MSADEGEKDEFGHPRFRGAAEVLAMMLRRDLQGELDTRNVNAVNPSYLYRSGLVCGLDMTWAARLGKAAVRVLSHALEGPVFLTTRWAKGRFHWLPYPLSDREGVEQLHRFVDPRFYDPRLYHATLEGKTYLRPIIGEMPMDAYGLAYMSE
jgi:6-phosphofructokinase 1